MTFNMESSSTCNALRIGEEVGDPGDPGFSVSCISDFSNPFIDPFPALIVSSRTEAEKKVFTLLDKLFH